MSDRDPASSSSSSSSSRPLPTSTSTPIRPPTSTDTLHPLLAPIGAPSFHAHHAHPAMPAAPPIPEKCLTFCSQRADAPPLCRMLCLRRRAKVLSRTEDLARLKGKSVRRDPAQQAEPQPTLLDQWTSTANGSGGGGGSSMEAARPFSSFNPFSRWNWNPFSALRKAVEPYSIIYVRGTPDGVVGRYMEEMEADDGNRDFGETISRHAKPRGREERVMEYLDWGDEGSLLHLPLSSVFHPITSMPSTVRTIFTPSYNILSLYIRSFTDGNGAQTRGAKNFLDAAYNLDGLTFLGKVRDHHSKMVKQRYEKEVEMQKEVKKAREIEAERRKERAEEVKRNMEGFTVDQPTAGDEEGKGQGHGHGEAEGKRYQGEIDRLRTGQGGSALRRKIEEAMERDEEYRRRKAAASAAGTGKGEGGPKSDDA